MGECDVWLVRAVRIRTDLLGERTESRATEREPGAAWVFGVPHHDAVGRARHFDAVTALVVTVGGPTPLDRFRDVHSSPSRL